MSDVLHPTAPGYENWAAAMAPTLERLLGSPVAPPRAALDGFGFLRLIRQTLATQGQRVV